MVRNRLEELQKNSKYVDADKVEDGAADIEMEPLRPSKDLRGSTADFFATFDENVVKNIDKVKANVEEIKKLQKKIMISVSKGTAEDEMNDLVEENKRLSRIIQTTIKSEKATLEERMNKQPSPIKKWARKEKAEDKAFKRKTELRMRQMQIETQANRFFKIWTEYNENQEIFRDKSKELLVRRFKIVDSQYNDEQIEAMLEEGKTEVFNECILKQTKAAQQQLTELQDRHDEFIKLERSIKELHDMFVEIGNLVTTQGETVDNIMQNVLRASEDVEKGRDHLKKAEGFAVSARKKKLILATIAIVVLLIILLVILSEFGAFSSRGKSHYDVPPPPPITTTSTTTTTTTTAPRSAPASTVASAVNPDDNDEIPIPISP